MDIHFCDLCNESVPQADIDRGRAFIRNGRVVCATCDRAMTAGEVHAAQTRTAPAAPVPAPSASLPLPVEAPVEGPGVGGVLIGLVALIFAAGGFALMIDRVDRLGADLDYALVGLGEELDDLDRRHQSLVAGLDGRLAETEARIHQDRDAGRDELVGAIAALRDDMARAAEQTALLVEDVAALRTAIEDGSDRARARMDEFTTRVNRFEEESRFFSDRLIELEESLRTLSTRPTVPEPGAGAGSDPAAAPWGRLLPDLSHANPGIRLEAIYALGETKDAGVIPYLIPMLKDEDLFVRMATARILQDLDARAAVPSLIDALEDPQSAVREAAMVALRTITSRDFRFEPLATEAEARQAREGLARLVGQVGVRLPQR